MTGVHQLTPNLRSACLHYQTLRMEWTPQTKMKTKTTCSGGSGIRDEACTAVGCKDDDDAAAYKVVLGRVGHRTQDSMESQDE